MNSEDYYILKPCKGSVGFTATPKKNIWLDLEVCAEKLKNAGYNVLDANVMLIAENDVEITVYRSGKILTKTDDKDAAKSAIEKAYGILIGD
ncbi:MAG: hypothetical protein KAI64_01280 [Thermoplasmata archaeon]|nr:hypothetical protein [Thermoplasmata archaeon]